MMCFRDMTFCSDADQCKNATGCSMNFDAEQQKRAEAWMKNPPVAFSSFKDSCEKWEQK